MIILLNIVLVLLRPKLSFISHPKSIVSSALLRQGARNIIAVVPSHQCETILLKRLKFKY